MKIFMGCKFTGLKRNADLISIGLVSHDDRTFYAELSDFDPNKADEWTKENVIDKLVFKPAPEGEQEYCIATRWEDNPSPNHISKGYNVEMRGNTEDVGKELRQWLSQFRTDIKIVVDCGMWDWILFVGLFGTAFDIPKNVNYIPFDLCTMMELNGVDPDIDREDFVKDIIYREVELYKKWENKHNALKKAVVIRLCSDKIYALKLN